MITRNDPEGHPKKTIVYHASMIVLLMCLRMMHHYGIDIIVESVFTLLIAYVIWAKQRCESTFAWTYIYAVIIFQYVIDRLDTYMPPVFLLYSTIPLVVHCVCDDMLLFVLQDKSVMDFVGKRSRDPLENLSRSERIKLSFVDFMTDNDLAGARILIFETYMLTCGMMAIRGAGLMHASCVTDAVLILTWIACMLSESKKIRSRKPPIPTPSYIAKAAYTLYSPPQYWVTVHALACIDVLMVKDWSIWTKIAGGTGLIMMAAIASRSDEYIYICPTDIGQ